MHPQGQHPKTQDSIYVNLHKHWTSNYDHRKMVAVTEKINCTNSSTCSSQKETSDTQRQHYITHKVPNFYWITEWLLNYWWGMITEFWRNE